MLCEICSDKCLLCAIYCAKQNGNGFDTSFGGFDTLRSASLLNPSLNPAELPYYKPITIYFTKH
jgi:hypothetical protein